MMLADLAGKEYSDSTAEIIDQEIKAIIDRAYADTKELLKANSDKLERLSVALLKYETLSGEEVRQIVEGKVLDKPTVDELLDAEKAKTPSPQPEPSIPPIPDRGTEPVPEPG